jgi:hypothetical protein
MARLDTDRQEELEPQRMKFAAETLIKLEYAVAYVGETELNFLHNGELIKFFPYSGWYSGKGVGSGRGLKNLLQKLKQEA